MQLTKAQFKEAQAVAISVEVEQKYGYNRPIPQIALDNPRLRFALETAAKCEDLIESEQDRIRELLTKAKNTVEIKAREFQIWYIKQYLTRAANIAKKRLAYFTKLSDLNTELELCKSDKHHWFEYYAWGYDPRPRTPLSTVPFELFPRQADLVEWLDGLVFDRRASGLIEKSRDEGATEIGVRWGVHNWRFRDGFSMLLSTRTEDEVDTKKKRGTLFERARFQIRLLPYWMLPTDFDLERDLLPDKMIANPENGNAMMGQAPVENMGRGDRVTCALFDEFAFWRFGGYPQYASMSQTTDSIIMPSSVAGKLNQYADIAFDGVTEKFVMDWRDNPFKNGDWYNSLPFGYISPKMSRTTIAQEIDRNYEASQPGKVWQYREELLFITLNEFLRPFEAADLKHRFVNEAGTFQLPIDWRWMRTSDYGQSEGHDWSYFLAAQPRESYPLHDTHFVFIAQNLEPTGLTTAQAVKQWREFEEDIGVRDINDWVHPPYMSFNSHEQKGLRDVLLGTYGETWIPWQTDYQEGIEQVQDWFEPVDVEDANPFRPELKGRCRIVFVAPNNEYQLAKNERLNQWFATISESERGYRTFRKQLSAYHYPITEMGKAVKAMRPVKEFDDIIDALRGYAVMWNCPAESFTPDEKYAQALQDMMPEPLKGKTAMEIAGMETIPGKMAPMLTLQMNEMLLNQRRREDKQYIPNEEEEDSMANGW